MTQRSGDKMKPSGQGAGSDATPFLQSLFTAVKDQYTERSLTFNQLDQKAQVTAAIASAFLAALFAFLRKETLDLLILSLGRTGLVMFAASGAGLLAVVLLCLMGLRVRRINSTPGSATLLQLLADMHSLDPPEQANAALFANFLREMTSNHLAAIAAMTLVNDRKAKYIAAAQLVLVISILSVAALLGAAVLRSRL